MSPNIDSLGREASRVTDQVAHWTPARWRLPAHDDDTRTFAEAMTTAVRRFSVLAARAEGIAERPVPVPDSEPVLVEQLRVLVADFRAALPSEADVDAAHETVRRLRAALF